MGKLPVFISLTAIIALLVGARPAGAIILNCPPIVSIKAIGVPYPWTAEQTPDAIMRFAEASYSCSNGTCTMSCSYAGAQSIYTLLTYKVAPGLCNYTNNGQSFNCTSIPPPRSHRKSMD
jgi:hypothetical protein